MAKFKPISGLDCSAPAEKMIPLVLRGQLRAMCGLREQALEWKDPEGVHDMRVLSRRLRSAINDFKPYLRMTGLPRQKLRAIADRLGDVRDQDVALMALDELKSKAKGATAHGIEILIEERKHKRKLARASLKSAIRKVAVDQFRRDFLMKLRATGSLVPRKAPAQPPAPPVVQSIKEVGAEVIQARLKDLVNASSCLYVPFEIKPLHELRILAKRLRYAVELFAVCWGEELTESAKEIALLQTSLGELHDCDVWIESLGVRLKRTTRKTRSDKDDMKLKQGATWLLRHFTHERTEHYRAALARWQKWQEEEFLDQLVAVLSRDAVNKPEAKPIT